MTKSMIVAVIILLQLIISLISYQYLTHREERKHRFREMLHFKFDYLPLIAVLIAFFVSVLIFVICFLLREESLMRAIMNAEVAMWLAVLGYIDAREKIIPNGLIGIGLIFWLLLILIDIFVAKTPWLQLLMFSGIGGIACGGLLFIIALIVKSALGMGDVKMFFVLGLLYGLMDAYGILMFSVIAMGIVSIILLIAKKVTMKSTIPMAPFVILGFLLSIFAGM